MVTSPAKEESTSGTFIQRTREQDINLKSSTKFNVKLTFMTSSLSHLKSGLRSILENDLNNMSSISFTLWTDNSVKALERNLKVFAVTIS